MPADTNTPVLEVENLRTIFPLAQSLGDRIRRTERSVRAVDGVSFSIKAGETLGLVGESGCGKSTLGRSVLRLTPLTSGEVRIEGQSVAASSSSALRALRQQAQIIFQDPAASLNPRMTIGQILEEPLTIYKMGDRPARQERVKELLGLVGLPRDSASRYPHQFSGGQRQRVGIAAALSLQPKLIVADEPTSALDVSVQAQILNLLIDIQRESNLAYLFISHNLEVVRYVSDRVAVMYLGKLVEIAPSEQLFAEPLHPYTRALLNSAPSVDPTLQREPTVLEGEPPSPINPPNGCRFHPRCPIAKPVCAQVEPMLYEETGHSVACHAVVWARAHRLTDHSLPGIEQWSEMSATFATNQGAS
ncbi:MAG: ABC transporter ATP-binding protein [Thermomicrobiales bacterium]